MEPSPKPGRTQPTSTQIQMLLETMIQLMFVKLELLSTMLEISFKLKSWELMLWLMTVCIQFGIEIYSNNLNIIGETDWKIVVINVNDPNADKINGKLKPPTLCLW